MPLIRWATSGPGAHELDNVVTGAAPIESPDGVVTTFTLPGGDIAISGSLEVFLNGLRYDSSEITLSMGGNSFDVIGTPIPCTGDTVSLNYIRG